MKLVFIDESGDAGYVLKNGSSEHLIFAGVIFENEKEALVADLAILRFKEQEKIFGELKYNKLRKSQKERVKNMTRNLKLDVKYYEFDKTKNPIELELYKKCLCNFFKLNETIFKDAKLYIDGKQDKKFVRKFKTEIANITKISTEQIKFTDSKNQLLIQLADIVAGIRHARIKQQKSL